MLLARTKGIDMDSCFDSTHGIDLDSRYNIGTPESHTYNRAKWYIIILNGIFSIIIVSVMLLHFY